MKSAKHRFISFFQEGFEFKKPTKPVSRSHMRSFSSCQSKDTFARRPSSAPALMVCILLKNRCPSWSIKCWPGSGKMLTLLIFSPVQLSSPPSVQQFDYYDSSPMFLRRSSLTSSLDDKDDGFLDIMDDNMEVRPCHLN